FLVTTVGQSIQFNNTPHAHPTYYDIWGTARSSSQYTNLRLEKVIVAHCSRKVKGASAPRVDVRATRFSARNRSDLQYMARRTSSPHSGAPASSRLRTPTCTADTTPCI
ncbi:unnamed protein product, partial [Ectocarpus sp. 12 AP-2014]